MSTTTQTAGPQGRFSAIKTSLRKLLALYLENAKLTVAEKLTLLMSAAMLFVICLILTAIALVFASIAVLNLLELAMSPILAATILTCVFLVLAVIVWFLRKPLIIDPTARFISKLIMDIGKTKIND
jgi:hypothetical protein